MSELPNDPSSVEPLTPEQQALERQLQTTFDRQARIDNVSAEYWKNVPREQRRMFPDEFFEIAPASLAREEHDAWSRAVSARTHGDDANAQFYEHKAQSLTRFRYLSNRFGPPPTNPPDSVLFEPPLQSSPADKATADKHASDDANNPADTS